MCGCPATETERTTTRFRFSQETIAIVTVGTALAGLNLAAVGDRRGEAREARAAVQADRAAWQAESRQFRDEARAKPEACQREFLRLTEAHAKVAAVVSTRPGEQQ